MAARPVTVSDREISSFVSASNPNHSLAGHVSEKDLAAELTVAVRTLRRWQVERTGPPITKIGRKIFYSREGISTWLQRREQRPCRTRSRRRSAR